MTNMETATTLGRVPGQTRAPVDALDVVPTHGHTCSPESRAAVQSRWAWISATVLSTLACWGIVGDHFALTRPMDHYVSLMVNQVASHDGVLNDLLHGASESFFLTSALLTALVWFCWFSNTAKHAREQLLLGFSAVLMTCVLSRLLQVSLPVRLRPMHDLASGFQPLPGIDPALAAHWGSFPSDHAAVFFALVTVIWVRSRWLGLLALASALYGVLPRMYFGLHYLSDVTAGAVLGVAFVLMFERFGPRTLARRGVGWEQRLPGLFYGVAFPVTFEVATLFDDIRQAARGLPAVLKALLG